MTAAKNYYINAGNFWDPAVVAQRLTSSDTLKAHSQAPAGAPWSNCGRPMSLPATHKLVTAARHIVTELPFLGGSPGGSVTQV